MDIFLYIIGGLLCLVAILAITFLQDKIRYGSWDFFGMKKSPHDNFDEIIVFKSSKKGCYRMYRGDCTVWHSYPSGVRCDTFHEGSLSNTEEWAKNMRELKQENCVGKWTVEELKGMQDGSPKVGTNREGR